MFFNDPETIIRLTPEWTGPRLPDGRPMVSEDVLRRMRKITFEEAWGPLWNMGYRNNWECNFKMTHGSDILVGRAVTAVMVPFRPDLDKAPVLPMLGFPSAALGGRCPGDRSSLSESCSSLGADAGSPLDHHPGQEQCSL